MTFLVLVRLIAHPGAIHEESAAKFSSIASVSVSKRETVFWLAALRSNAFFPIPARIAGSG